MKIRSMMVAGAALAAMMLAPFGAQADEASDNEENCLRAEGRIALYAGTDAGAARRGLWPGTYGCLTAGDPDLPFVDLNYMVPGATHAIVGLLGVAEGVNPGPATWQLGDQTIEIEWRWATDPSTQRWESQSIPLLAGTGTAHITVEEYGVAHYYKVA